MAFVNADRCKETSTTTGTGTYSLAGAVAGFRTFVAGIGGGNTCTYVAENGTDWEVGIGTVTDAAPDTLARTVILASSNAGAAVNWGAGTRNLFCAYAAAHPPVITKHLAANEVSDEPTNTTMGRVVGLDQTVQIGTWWFEYRIIWRTSVTGTAVKVGVNFTGTQTRFVVEATHGEATTAASTGAADQVHAAFGLRSGGGNRAPSTTTVIYGPVSADTADADMMVIVKGVITVTVAGTLELYFGSEATGSTQTIMAGSGLRLTRMD